jgi:hypothetical protein
MKTFKNLLVRKLSFIILFVFATATILTARDYYQIKVYTLKDKAQETAVDSYLKDAYLPALHKAGVKKLAFLNHWPTRQPEQRFLYLFL